MTRLSDLHKRIRQTLIDKFGNVYEAGQYNDYWHSVEYIGPFRREYDGKFCYGAPLDRILKDAKRLKPFVRNNEVIGFKHRTSENSKDDPFYGQPPVMLVYAKEKERDKIRKILESIGVTRVRWIADGSTIDPLEMSFTQSIMQKEGRSSPYS